MIVIGEEQTLASVVVVRALAVRVLVTAVPEGRSGCEPVCSVPQITSARFQVAEFLSVKVIFTLSDLKEHFI